MEREKLDIVCFGEVLKTTHFDAFLFHRIGYFGTTDSVELNMAFFDLFNSLERSISRKKRTIVHKCFV